MFLYCITCKTNGKCYIGISVNPIYRFTDHARADSLIGKAIRKHGKENFEMRVLVKGTDEYIADLEPKAILAFHTLQPAGYNLSLQTQTSFKHHDMSREKMRKPKSAAARRNMSIAKKGKPGPTRKGMTKLKVYRIITPDGEFPCVEDASKFYNIGISAIYQRCSGKVKSFQNWKAIKE